MSEQEAPEQEDQPEGDAHPRRPSRSERRRSRRHARADAERKRPFRRMVPNLILSAILFFFIGLILTEQPLPLPGWARAELETRVNAQFEDNEALRVGRAAVSLGPSKGPRVQLRNIEVGTPDGGMAAVFNSLQATLVSGALVQGKLRPEIVRLEGAQVTLRRGEDGSFSFTNSGGNVSLADLLGQLDDLLSDNTFASIREITAEDVVLTVEDARTGRIWQATGAEGVLRRDASGLSLSLTSDVFNGTDDIAVVQLSFDYTSDSRDTSLGVRIENMPAADIAQQSPILAWLGVLDAPISGAVRADYDGSSGLTALAGTLDIAQGALSPVEGSEPLPFDSARAYFRFDPERQRLNFSEVSVNSDSLSLLATGKTYLSELDNGWPSAFVSQFNVEEVRLSQNEVFENTVALADVTADLRLRLDPFTVDIAQLTAPNDGAPVRAKAHIEARSEGWSFSIDAETTSIVPDTVLAFWPLVEARNTRQWLSQNVQGGRLTDVTASVRKPVGGKPVFGMNFDVEDGLVSFLPDMPPVREGRGRGSIVNDQFTLVLSEGHLAAPGGGLVDGAGSVLTVPDIEEKPTRGVFDIRARGELTDMLTVLNNRPLNLLDRLQRTADFATGEATVLARLELPLIKDLPIEDVAYNVTGVLNDAASENIVKGRTLASDALRLTVDPDTVSISGGMSIDGVPLRAAWQQDVSDEGTGASTVTGRINLSADTLAALNVPLPSDLLNGTTQADFQIDVPPSGPPQLTLTSNLRGVALSFSGIGWEKPRQTPASFSLNAVLGEVPDITDFALDAPGLTLSGQADVAASGEVSGLVLETVRVGNWFNGAATVALGDRAPSLTLTAGRLDLRNLPSFPTSAGGGAVGVALDELVVTDNIRLGPFRGDLTQNAAGLSGDFQGRLNGGTIVRAALAPTANGTGIRIQANDAGGALRDARLTPNARGGTMDIVLSPVSRSQPGTYNGQFLIENTSLKDAPVMAAILNAVSVVGLLEQLGGGGIQFGTIDGTFRMTPDRLTFSNVAATGASMGISANGIYDMASDKMDIEGVVSPFYFLNAVGGIVSRRGEGLFGVNYRVSGDVSRPRVSVNPLSILTPGAFRQIFRRAPPTE